jgi:quinol-cytochrome oxidoreductase complex cytochrome b subunit
VRFALFLFSFFVFFFVFFFFFFVFFFFPSDRANCTHANPSSCSRALLLALILHPLPDGRESQEEDAFVHWHSTIEL